MILAQRSSRSAPLGLVPSHPSLRPADVFTSAAVHGRLAALDVGVTSPDAAGAGNDCTHAMVLDKCRFYAPHFDALRRAGIHYLPVVWSAYGRPHPDASKVLVTLARAVARRRGEATFRGLARQWAARITTEVWRRAANMVLACWPVPSGGGDPDVVGIS